MLQKSDTQAATHWPAIEIAGFISRVHIRCVNVRSQARAFTFFFVRNTHGTSETNGLLYIIAQGRSVWFVRMFTLGAQQNMNRTSKLAQKHALRFQFQSVLIRCDSNVKGSHRIPKQIQCPAYGMHSGWRQLKLAQLVAPRRLTVRPIAMGARKKTSALNLKCIAFISWFCSSAKIPFWCLTNWLRWRHHSRTKNSTHAIWLIHSIHYSQYHK